MNTALWTISKTIPEGLPSHLTSDPAQHDGEYYWCVAAEDAAPTTLPDDLSSEDLALALLRILLADGEVTVTKTQAILIHAHPLHRMWSGKYESQMHFETDYNKVKDIIGSRSAANMAAVQGITASQGKAVLRNLKSVIDNITPL